MQSPDPVPTQRLHPSVRRRRDERPHDDGDAWTLLLLLLAAANVLVAIDLFLPLIVVSH